MTRLSYKTLFIILLFLLIPIVFLLRINQKPKSVLAEWFNDSWTYRQRVDISGVGSTTLTDFQVSFNIGTSALINSGKMKSDCSDIRITDQSGQLLPHWIEENNPGCNSTATKIWIKLPSLPSSGAAVYLYYGNPSAANVQNGNNVFQFFDDFNDNNISDWTQQTGSSWTVSGGVVSTSSDGYVMYHSLSSAVPITVGSRMRLVADVFWNDVGVALINDALDGYTSNFWTSNSYIRGNTLTNGKRSAVTTTILSPWTPGTSFWVQELVEKGSGNRESWNRNFGIGGTWTENSKTSLNKIALYHETYSSGANAGQYDWVYARKYASADPSPTLAAEEVGGGPVAWWKFDEGVGTSTFDSTSNLNHGLISGATWQPNDQCISGKCLKFDGNNNYIDLGNPSSLNITGTTVTYETWVKLNSLSTYQTIMIKEGAGTTWNGLWFVPSGTTSGGQNCTNKFLFGLNTTWLVCSTTTPIIGNWYHIVGQYNGATTKIYVNGNLEYSSNYSTAISSTTSTFKIGRRSDGYSLNGFIDNSKVYPYARSAAQIKQDYTSGLSGQSSSQSSSNVGSNSAKGLSDGLIGYWKFDEGVGTTAADSSGNSNTATFGSGSSAPGWSNGKYGIGLSFDGSYSYINMGTSPTFNFTNQITISSWVNLSTLPNAFRWIVRKGYGGAPFFFGINGGNRVVLVINDDSNLWNSSTAPIATTGWHLWTGTYDGQQVKMYIDGQYTGWSYNKTGNISNNSLPVLSGMDTNSDGIPDSQKWKDLLDEVRIYNRALNPTEVKALYNYAPGPVAYYKFEEGVGTTAIDFSGNNFSAYWTGSGSPHWKTGKIGKSSSFNGNNDYLTITNNPILSFGNRSFTISAWVNPASFSNTGEVISKGILGLSGAEYRILINTNGKPQFQIQQDTGTFPSVIATFAIPLNQWSYLTGQYDSSNNTIKLIVNGTESYSTSTAGVVPENGTHDVWIGNGYQFFNGLVDEVKIYNYARTQSQILEDMGTGTGSPKDPIAWYKFDEGSGSTANNSGVGGNTFNGSLGSGTSAPVWVVGKINKALIFDGNNDYVSIPSYTPNSDNFTFTGWFNLDSSVSGTNDYFPPLGNMQNVPFFGFNPTSKTFYHYRQYASNSQTMSWATPIQYADSSWHYFALVIDQIGYSAGLYIDNKFIGNQSIGTSGYTHVNGAFVAIGRDYGTSWKGSLDEIKRYNYALSADDIKTDYNSGASFVFGGSNQTIGATTTSLDYCVPGSTDYCIPPVGEWKFEEGTGTTAVDTSGNNNNGTFGTGSSAPSWTNGKLGKAISFNGSNIVTIPVTSILKPPQVTFSTWFKTASSNEQYIMTQSEDSFYLRISNTGKIGFWINTVCANWLETTNSYNDNRWHFLSANYSNTSKLIYIDGILSASNNSCAGGAFPFTNTAFQIGIRSASYPQWNWIGQIDDVKIYNYARTPAQIAYDYNKGAPIAWWKLDECQGVVANDSSGMNNNGSINIGSAGSQNSLGTCSVGTSAAWTNGSVGKINSSLNFDGTDDEITVSDTNIPSGALARSFSLWVKPNSLQDKTIIGYGTVNNLQNFNINLSSAGNVGVWWNNNNPDSDFSNSKYIANQWNHIVITYDGSKVISYINAVNKDTVNANLNTIRSGVFHVASGIVPGWASFYNFAKVQLDDIRIYNYALNSTQIKTLYNGGAVNFK